MTWLHRYCSSNEFQMNEQDVEKEGKTKNIIKLMDVRIHVLYPNITSLWCIWCRQPVHNNDFVWISFIRLTSYICLYSEQFSSRVKYHYFTKNSIESISWFCLYFFSLFIFIWFEELADNLVEFHVCSGLDNHILIERRT